MLVLRSAIALRILTPQRPGYFDDPKTPLLYRFIHPSIEGPWWFLGYDTNKYDVYFQYSKMNFRTVLAMLHSPIFVKDLWTKSCNLGSQRHPEPRVLATGRLYWSATRPTSMSLLGATQRAGSMVPQISHRIHGNRIFTLHLVDLYETNVGKYNIHGWDGKRKVHLPTIIWEWYI